MGAGGREGDLRRRKTVRSRDVWFGGCFCRWSSSGEVDDIVAGAGQTTQSSLRHVSLCRSHVDLNIIGLVVEAVEAEVAVGGVEEDLRNL